MSLFFLRENEVYVGTRLGYKGVVDCLCHLFLWKPSQMERTHRRLLLRAKTWNKSFPKDSSGCSDQELCLFNRNLDAWEYGEFLRMTEKIFPREKINKKCGRYYFFYWRTVSPDEGKTVSSDTI